MRKTLLSLNIDGAFCDIDVIFEEGNEQETYLEMVDEMGDSFYINVGEKNEEVGIEFINIYNDAYAGSWIAHLNINGMEMKFYLED